MFEHIADLQILAHHEPLEPAAVHRMNLERTPRCTCYERREERAGRVEWFRSRFGVGGSNTVPRA